jgi:cytochrome c oxidase cbb3-type subunit 3
MNDEAEDDEAEGGGFQIANGEPETQGPRPGHPAPVAALSPFDSGEKMRFTRSISVTLCALSIALAFASCERERREFKGSPPPVSPVNDVRQSELRPGPPMPDNRAEAPYVDNAYAMSEGKRLFESMNCVGCHAHGGGAIGPPLIDEKWIYGASPENIYATIVEGRPNGMPAFADKIPNDQIWQIVAYVRSLNGMASKDAAPSRSDHMQAKPAEQSTKQEPLRTQRAERKQ